MGGIHTGAARGGRHRTPAVWSQQDGDYIRSVTLLAYRDAADIIRFSYFALLGLISAMGIVELILLHFERET